MNKTVAKPFPLQGVAGIIANNADELAQATARGLHTVEVRADLLLHAGMSEPQLLDLVRAACTAKLSVLFTLRHPSHDGRFAGSESERVALNNKALRAGAVAVDAELGSECARQLLAQGAPVVLSHHDFTAMPDEAELAELTKRMLDASPLAMKLVPTARNIGDAARMLAWVAASEAGGPKRIGFAMGASGTCSRILTIAFGAPITYASFGASVAPGQVGIDELLEVYRAHELDAQTRVYGIAGSHSLTSFSPFLHNPAFHSRNINAVYVPFQTDDFVDLCASLENLRVDGMSVTTPFKEQALSAANSSDERSRACGAANTLVASHSAGNTSLAAFNTDFDGVLIPIETHLPVRGLRVAIVGNGGAARGAVQALKTAGAELVMFYRNAERGQPVADEFGIRGTLLDSIDDSFDVYINATTLGTNPGDPSPIPASVLKRPQQIAFEMLYQNPNSQFIADAQAAGVRIVRGAQMLVAQGTVQFQHFAGALPTLAEFSANFERGKTFR
jgi:3-dehydroquinate dehydratase / shikimate dehydrogenase